jgi:hypothetical protein
MCAQAAFEVCERVAAGESASAVLSELGENGATGTRAFLRYLAHPSRADLRERWALALATRCEFDLESLRDVFFELHDELDGKDRLALLKLHWDAMRWMAAKRLPDRYGDGPRGRFAHLSDQELMELAAEYGIVVRLAEEPDSGDDGEAEGPDSDEDGPTLALATP